MKYVEFHGEAPVDFQEHSEMTAKIQTLITTYSWPILDVLGTSVTRTIVCDDHESLLKINWS